MNEALSVVERYLAHHFPGVKFEQQHDGTREIYKFKFQIGGQVRIVAFTHEFLADHYPAEIERILDNRHIVQEMQARNLLVTTDEVRPYISD